MMRAAVLRHEVIRRLPKFLIINFSLVTLVFNLMVFKHVDQGDGLLARGAMLVMVQVCVMSTSIVVVAVVVVQ